MGDGHLMLTQHVVTHHAELSLAVGHVDGHITVSDQQRSGPAAEGWHHQLTVVRVQHR